MGFSDKFKNLFNISEEDFIDDIELEDEDDEEEVREVKSDFSFGRQRSERENKVVEMRSTTPSSKAHVEFKKIDRFEEVGGVADALNEKRIVILNLESCANDITVRIIDFLSGVTYANGGDIKRVAGRAYILTPYNVPLTGELLDEVERSKY